jgi:hypothetical protein
MRENGAWIVVLSAVMLMVMAAGPAAWGDNIAAAGDISKPIGGSRNDQATARLLAPSSGNGIGLVLALGDTQYECGEMENYLGAYELSWGQFKGITRPAPGHHEYLTSSPIGCLGQAPGPMRMLRPAGADYYQYFAGRTPPHPGYYSFNAEGWHFVVLNTVCTVVPGGCFGAMVDWLRPTWRRTGSAGRRSSGIAHTSRRQLPTMGRPARQPSGQPWR